GSENVILTGWFLKGVDFGGVALTAVGGSDVFVAKFASSGSHLWSKRFGDTSSQTGSGVAVDPSGNIFVSGTLGKTIDFGTGPLAGKGNGDIFLAKRDPNGNGIWAKSFGDNDIQNGGDLAVDRRGDVTMGGGFYGTVDFGGGPMTGSVGSSPIF